MNLMSFLAVDFYYIKWPGKFKLRTFFNNFFYGCNFFLLNCLGECFVNELEAYEKVGL